MSRFLAEALSGIAPYTPGEQPQGIADLLKLNTNENPYPPAPGVAEVLAGLDGADLRLYPDPTCARLKAALADFHGLPATCFSVGNGSDEILDSCVQGLCGHGVAYPDITYSFYPALCALHGVQSTQVPLRDDFTWAPEDYAGCTQTIIVANPNAPTGIAAPLEVLCALLEQDADRLVIVDEAYVDFGARSAVELLPDHDNLLVVRTFSKSRSLAGMRLAYAVASPELASDLEAIRFSFNPYNLDRIALAVAEASVADRAYFEQTCQTVAHTRDWTACELAALGFDVLPSAANFVFAAPPCDARSYVAALRAHGIIVRYFDAPRIADRARITIGTPDQMRRFVDTTRDILAQECPATA